jgi:hypothetical protein
MARIEQGASFYYQNGVQAEPDSAPRVSSPEADSMNLDSLCWWFDRSQNVGLDIDLLGHKLYNFDIGLLGHKRDAAISCGLKCTRFSSGQARLEIVGISGMAVTRF